QQAVADADAGDDPVGIARLPEVLCREREQKERNKERSNQTTHPGKGQRQPEDRGDDEDAIAEVSAVEEAEWPARGEEVGSLRGLQKPAEAVLREATDLEEAAHRHTAAELQADHLELIGVDRRSEANVVRDLDRDGGRHPDAERARRERERRSTF